MSYGHVDQDRMLNATQRLDEATDQIEQSNAILEDTVGVEMDSLQELRRQREVISSDKDTLDKVNIDLDTSNKTLKGMLRRAITNKIFLCVIIIVFLVIIGLVIYFGFFFFKKD
ncbi:vesicle transport V-snare protein vti1a, putative [Entamoeba invadens IP1]|uniref:Vesicle transport V-snare protein vti1a, putative n=1 Tax=Entamoeba invadens IP1 TaxID=370355 RepID=A0A0A1UDY7_ENTIV|nr:vesicle transport V-snare protein vti1a, putative [Entamoeba invadens IP1]ELP94805.1 vesicle transport V-snare protein vti1a, putative [Entamoeba invadens IP1]|eukprot:XP_004261576.1 vesicle transport V-snare protein vti1a, putative [Entamoeba invadens IP1]